MERVVTPHGLCVLVELADAELDAALAVLHADERLHAATLSPGRRRDFIAGRTALHAALVEHGDHAIGRTALLADDRGAPRLPAGLSGSISHKGRVAGAIVGTASVGFVGIDLEHAAPPRIDIARRILTDRELAALPVGAAEPHARGREVTLRFAVKEAIYKAVDPIVRRYVGFREVELDMAPTTAAVTHALPAHVETTWREHGGLWLATARAARL